MKRCLLVNIFLIFEHTAKPISVKHLYNLPSGWLVLSFFAFQWPALAGQPDVQLGETPVVDEKHRPHSATSPQQLCT